MSKKVEYLLIRNEPRFEGDDENWVSCVELTEEDMGALEIACDSIEAYNKECANKIRKVLENDK